MKIQKLSLLQEIVVVVVEFESTVKKSPREHSFILIDLLPIPVSGSLFTVSGDIEFVFWLVHLFKQLQETKATEKHLFIDCKWFNLQYWNKI